MPSPTSVARRRSRADRLLFEQHRRSGGAASREALVERFLPLARHLARRYRAGGDEDDLVQVASIGLLKAIDRFDPARGIAFSSFAVPTILGELKRYFRDHGWAVRVPREVQELAVRLGPASEVMSGELRRAPTPAELARRCGVTVEQVLEALATESAHHPVALERPREGEAGGPGAEDPALSRVEDALELDGWLALLGEREQTVLRLRFEHDLRQREIGERLGISQMQVSRVIRGALSTLQQAAAEASANERRAVLRRARG